MSFVDNTTSLWTGTDAAGFYSKALLTGESKSMVKLYPNVKSKIKIPRFDMSGLLQEADCSFTDGGTSTLSEKTLEVCPLKVNIEICQRTFEQDYLSMQLKAGSNNTEVAPASIENYILDQIALNISKETESLFWNGNTAGSPASLCDGVITLVDADIAKVKVTAATLSASNIFAEIAKVYALIPDTIINKGKVVIFVSNAAAKYYIQAIAAINPLGGTYNAGNYSLNYLGIPLVIAPGMTANQMVAAEPENLFYGTDLVSDLEDIMLIPQKNLSGAPTARFVCEFKFGVQFGVVEEIVIYTA
jgi:hypothetical protein